MLIPRGNALFEKQNLPYSDINVLYGNLEQQGFTGFIQLENGTVDYLFFSHGQFLRALECEDQHYRVLTRARVLNKIKGEVPTSVYVLDSAMANVLSLSFAFQPLYRNVEVRKKEFKKIRDQLEGDEQTGILYLNSREHGRHYLLADRGRLVYNNLVAFFGQIMCGVDEVNRFLDTIAKAGAQLNVYAEKAPEIDNKRRETEERLERVKVLLAKTQTGLFVKEDVVSVDEYIAREWGLRPGSAFGVELELADGTIVTVKCQSAKKLGGYVNIPAKLMKRVGLRDSDALSVQPIM